MAIPGSSSGPAIRTAALSKRYGRTVALDGLDLDVPRGEAFGFLGPNGAGKTTAVKLLLGLAFPTAGTGEILGSPIGDRPTRARIGYLPELFRYQPWLSAREVLGFHCELSRLPRPVWAAAIDGALATVGLAARGDDRVGTFSKGMQQRLGLGVALLGPPALVILDEPTSALDPLGRQDVRTILHGLREQGVTVFLNSHLLTEVERVCDRVAVVDRGRVVATGRLAELLAPSGVVVVVDGLPPDAAEVLAPLGTVSVEGDRLTVEGLAADGVPELVARIVGLGGRVRAVEPEQHTLEERFLDLIGPRGRGES